MVMRFLRYVEERCNNVILVSLLLFFRLVLSLGQVSILLRDQDYPGDLATESGHQRVEHPLQTFRSSRVDPTRGWDRRGPGPRHGAGLHGRVAPGVQRCELCHHRSHANGHQGKFRILRSIISLMTRFAYKTKDRIDPFVPYATNMYIHIFIYMYVCVNWSSFSPRNGWWLA